MVRFWGSVRTLLFCFRCFLFFVFCTLCLLCLRFFLFSCFDKFTSMERLLLRKIRLQGFKSYGEEKTIDGFDENLTCICGPNGSGKSSLVEAISFVLQSRLTKKELQQLQNDTKGCQQAMSVSLYFEKQGANGSQHLLIEKEVKNGKYNCYVNENLESWDGPKRQLKMNEAVKFVKKFGLDIQFPERFIVFQMRTIEVAGKTPEKLLHFLEKIIGTSQLRQNIEAQKEMLSELRMNCAQNEENIGSLQKKRELLEPKVNQFERYVQEKESFSKALLEFLKEKTFYKLSRTVDVTRRAGDLTQQHKEISSKLKMKQKKLFFQEKRTKEAEAAVAASALDEKNVSKVLQKANLANGRLESQKTSLQSAWQLLENQFETFRKTVDQANERISVLKEDLSSLRCKGGKASCLTPEQTKKIEAFQTKAAVSRKSLRTAEQEHSSLQNTYSAICKEFEKKISSFEAQNGTIREESQMTSKQRTQLDSSSKSIEIRIQKLQEERSMLQQRLDSARETVASHQQKLRAVTKSLEFFLLASGTARAEKAVDFLKSKRRDIYGFLCSLAIVPGPAQMAVNQVLFPLLPKVIVVENRSAANVVINYFKEHKIGIVQCEILSELPAPSSTPIPQDGLTPLLDVFQYSAKKFEKVFWKFTQSWWLAESSSSAIGLSYENYGGCVTRRNIVSLDGTVAYSWGSVLRNLKRINKISSHVMKDSFPETLPYQEENSQKRSDLEHCVANGEASLESSASDVRKLSQDIQKIDREIEDLGAEASDLSEKFQRESRIRSEFQRRIEMINSEIEKLVKAHEKQKAKLEDLISRSQSKLEEIKKTDEIREATDCKELGEEVLEHYLVRQEIHQVEEQLQKEELISSMTSESMSPVEIELSKKRKQIEKIMLELKVQQKLTEKLKKKREEAKGRLREALRERDQQQKRLSAKEDTISDLQTAISSLRKKRAKIDVDLEGLRFSVQESASQYKSELRKVARDPALSESPTEPRSCDELSDDEMDIEEENDETPDSLPLLLDADVLAPGLCDEFEVWKGNYEKDPGMAIKKLEGESEEMKHKRLRLLALKDQVDLPALAENSKLEENVSCCMEYVEKTKQEIQSLSSKILSLETERFNRFSNAITSLNESLSTTYYHLNPYGDCSLHFNPHRELIFDGVWLKVRPDRVWKDFHSLSGGQKALAALALSLAFQQQYPSPLYVFDEVDASLDIVAVERLAKFIIQHSSESSSQFIVVSLRPEFFQWAPVLVGTHFTSSGVSNSIVFRPRRTDEEEEEML